MRLLSALPVGSPSWSRAKRESSRRREEEAEEKEVSPWRETF